jgi:hypothetical protein
MKQKHLPGGSEMSKHENRHSRRARLGMIIGFILRRRVLAVIAAILMCASLVFTLRASAHNISLANAQNMVLQYAETVVDESKGKYIQAETDCYNLFPGHNHYVRCEIYYKDQATKNTTGQGVCYETVDVYVQSHRDGQSFKKWMRHTSYQHCGKRALSGPNP